MREEIFYHVIELLRDHKDLQQLPQCKDLEPFLSLFYTVPEEGRLNTFGEYKINNKHVLVTIWGSNKQYRFTWKKIVPHLLQKFDRPYLF